jgi:hypothetical protein
MANRLDPQPFRDWCEKKLGTPGPADEIGAEANTLSNRALALQLGLHEDVLRRWRRDYPTLKRADVEDALHRVGVPIADLYPDLAAEDGGGHRWCPGCKEVVPTTEEKHCLWCDRRCYFESKPNSAISRRKLTDSQLRALHRIHARGGASVKELGRRVWKQAGYSNAHVARSSIRNGFKRLGLPVIPQRARTGLSYCEEIVQYGPRKGRKCGLPKGRGSEVCWNHDEDRAAERRRHIEQMVANRQARREVAA